jgi:hypothetical protein
VQWHTSVIPATQEAEVEGSQTEASPSKSIRPYLKNKLKAGSDEGCGRISKGHQAKTEASFLGCVQKENGHRRWTEKDSPG